MVVVVFRITLRADLDVADYEATGARMAELAVAMPGFVGMDYAEVEGGELLVVRFASHETLAAWRNHPEHLEAQQAGRERFFAHYSIEVCDELRSYEFDAADPS
jgi:heme-degrading monooxygenase HmoA